ncbi:MAG TPA: chromosomal replication initiator protein DnaA [Thermoanaerobaculia bacterium]|jgi:chromosomal replication initiator protein|nr:chromosomal replication initiator protein DnaA [Thermoanaerobaculia bacterium]
MSSSLWSALQKQLQQDLDSEEFATWFLPLRVRDESDGRLVLAAPNARFLRTLEESYRTTVEHALDGLGEPRFEVLFTLEEEQEDSGEYISASHFNPKYVFSTFVVGKSNEFAHAAAKAVAANPSESYNPLFLYGGVGLGKTHLLHAIGHEILRTRPQLRVLYLAAEQFVNELINSIRFERMPEFRERYRTIDVLLIDDIQFIANKERTQEEFFHTFNTLYTSQKQIILTSDSSPRNIPTLEERLRSRFEWGLIADIQQPDLETKVAILQRKAYLENSELPDDVAEFIAQQVKSNIRELEGLLNRVIAFASLTGKPLSPALARETLKDILPEEGKKPAAADIIKAVARHYDLKVADVKSKSNARQIVIPRQVAMYLCKKLTDLSYPEIGKLFNDKHHSTVMYSVEKVADLRKSDPDFDRTLQKFEQHFT